MDVFISYWLALGEATHEELGSLNEGKRVKMKSFRPWVCKSPISACFLALALIWTCTSVHADIPCENNCRQTDNHQADCEVFGCRNGCISGWYGFLCNKRCSRRCKDLLCNQTDGKCIKGCKERWFGLHNDIICKGSSRNRVQRDIVPTNKRCLRKNVDNQKTCECCLSGYRGPNCSISCENCTTYNDSDLCKYMCKGGYYGDTCNMTCSENCATGNSGTHLCHAKGDGTVKCSNGCIRGRYGKYCSYVCSQSCRNERCYQHDGTCIACPDNRYGSYCNMSCSEMCQQNITCIDGCKEGYSGLKCGQNCLNSSCQAQTGNPNLTFVCTHGCVDGYMGWQCQEQCPVHCTNCSKLPYFSSCKHTSGNEDSDSVKSIAGVGKGSSKPFDLSHVMVPMIIIVVIIFSLWKCGYCDRLFQTLRRLVKRRETQTDEPLLNSTGNGSSDKPGAKGDERTLVSEENTSTDKDKNTRQTSTQVDSNDSKNSTGNGSSDKPGAKGDERTLISEENTSTDKDKDTRQTSMQDGAERLAFLNHKESFRPVIGELKQKLLKLKILS